MIYMYLKEYRTWPNCSTKYVEHRNLKTPANLQLAHLLPLSPVAFICVHHPARMQVQQTANSSKLRKCNSSNLKNHREACIVIITTLLQWSSSLPEDHISSNEELGPRCRGQLKVHHCEVSSGSAALPSGGLN